QYEAVMGTNPSHFKGPQNPVEQVSWDDAVGFCRKLSELPAEKAAGHVYRLPTEAEWEYACRAGTKTAYSFGERIDLLGDYAWYDEISGKRTHPVCQKGANLWGLYDMHGNVWEWCQDWFSDYRSGAVTNPTGAVAGSNRVYRGGCWYINRDDCRSAHRNSNLPSTRLTNVGFRVLRSSIKKSQHPSQPVGQTPSPAVAPFDAVQAKAHQQANTRPQPPAWLENDLLGYYRLDGNALADGEGQADGKTENVKWTSDRFDRDNKAAHFHGDLSSYIELRPANVRRHNLTVSCWVKVDDGQIVPKQVPVIWSIPRGASGSGSSLSLSHTQHGGFPQEITGTISVGSHGVGGFQGELDVINKGWFHYTFVMGENSSRMYENGNLVGFTNHDSTKDLPVHGTIQLGRGLLTTVTSSHMVYARQCDLDDFRIYGRVLTDDEVKELYEYESVAPDDGTIPAPAVAPFDAAQAKAHQTVWAEHLGTRVETTNSIGMKLNLIPPGEFTMGDGDDAHQVTLTQAFEMGIHEVTQEQYEAVMGTTPSNFKGPQNPVEQVSWDDAVEFCRKLSALPAEKKAGYVYRLPTEAEWEYACRAGTTTAYSFGDDASELGEYAWLGGKPHPVGLKKPNPWGLYDMHGNVWEWCQDWYGAYPSGSLTDPTGAAVGSTRVNRSGRPGHPPGRSARRDRGTPDDRSNYHRGFRVLRSSIK
ncbi:MAG: SUMF1/EgtB/PvdO family nonheme iron enzyme, partial [Pirellulales bacterium]|nr:SUMF1/EgtB/PvdO family nonheme iron enzyme [Pirellulales bacterium]